MDKLLKLIQEAVENGKIDEKSIEEMKKEIDFLIEEKAQSLFEAKEALIKESNEEKIKELVKEAVEEKENEIREELEKEVKDNLKVFSDFVDMVVEEITSELTESFEKYALIGEEYEDVIEAVKSKIYIEEDKIPEDVLKTMEEASETIKQLQENVDELIGENMKYKIEIEKLKVRDYLKEKTEELNPVLSKIVINHFEDSTIDEIKEEIDEFIENLVKIVESNKNDEDPEKKVEEEEDDDLKNKNKDKGVEKYLEFFNRD